MALWRVLTLYIFLFTEPDQPTDIHFINITEDSTVIIWSAPRAQITGYRLFLTAEGSNPKQLRIPARLSQYTILNLQPDTVYTATLHAEKGNVLSEGSTATFATSEFLFACQNTSKYVHKSLTTSSKAIVVYFLAFSSANGKCSLLQH